MRRRVRSSFRLHKALSVLKVEGATKDELHARPAPFPLEQRWCVAISIPWMRQEEG